jgi:hypothetical protein
MHNSFSRCSYIHAYVLYNTVHFKRTHAVVKGAEKFHYILAFIIQTTVYDSHEIIYGIILEYYETRKCNNENKNINIIKERTVHMAIRNMYG